MPADPVTLAVTPYPEDARFLETFRDTVPSRLETAPTVADALTQTDNLTSAAVVLCERDLPDGTWKDLLARLRALPSPPRLIVTSLHADERLWAEVLNLGGYDVLAKPFDRREVQRVWTLACRTASVQAA